MNCEQFRDVLPDLTRNEALDVATLNDALKHADACRVCDALLEESENLTADLHVLATMNDSQRASARVETALLEILARKRLGTMRSVNLRAAVVAGVMAVAALAIFAILFLHGGRPETGPKSEQPATPAAPATNSRNSREEAAIVDSGISPGAQADAENDTLSAFEDEQGSTGSFVPLTESFDPSALEGSTVLRVALSRRAVQKFGLSAGSSNSVLADMVVTSDGTPQAIRLLNR